MKQVLANNETFGISVQSAICKIFKINEPNFKERVDPVWEEILIEKFKPLFEKYDIRPKECLTFRSQDKFINFLLADGKSLSVKSNIKGSKQAPNSIGQAGDHSFNRVFGHLYDGPINRSMFKRLVMNVPRKLVPIYLDYLFLADYNLWVYIEKGEVITEVISRGDIPELDWDSTLFSFTRNLSEWNESNTLKYNELSLGEFQVHTNRTGYKFRFNMKNLLNILSESSLNNESLGITAEYLICKKFNLEYPIHLDSRRKRSLENRIQSALNNAFKELPNPVQFIGSDSGMRGGASKSNVDFVLEQDRTLSLKTNWSKRVCPSEVGQPSQKTFLKYFGKLFSDEFTDELFKKVCQTRTSEMMQIYLNHLFDCDFLLWIYKEGEGFTYKILKKQDCNYFDWDQQHFDFSQTVESWNESCTVKYMGKSLGEFQIHTKRNCYKFRFNMKTLCDLLFENV